MEVTTEDFKKALRDAGLEKAGEDVVFPWGVKIVELDGDKKALQPMTPQEYGVAVKEATGKILSDEQILAGGCILYYGTCRVDSCKGYCDIKWGNGGYFCMCSDH